MTKAFLKRLQSSIALLIRKVSILFEPQKAAPSSCTNICALLMHLADDSHAGTFQSMAQYRTSIMQHMDNLAATNPALAMPHADDIAIDEFTAQMKAKMASAREAGRSGWEDPAQCTADQLRNLLRTSIRKGDPIDVANFAMMLHWRGETTRTELSIDIINALREAEKTGALAAELPGGAVMFINRGEQPGDDPADLQDPEIAAAMRDYLGAPEIKPEGPAE